MICILSCPFVWTGGNNNHAQSTPSLFLQSHWVYTFGGTKTLPPCTKVRCKAKDSLCSSKKKKKKERKKRKKKGIPPHALCYLIIILTLIINFRIIRWLWIDSLVRVFWYTTSSLIFGIGDACSLGIGPGRPPILNGWERYIKYFDMLFPLRIWCVHNILMELHENWHAWVKNMHIFH